MLYRYLTEKAKNKGIFSLSELRKKFPTEKKEIGSLLFIGLIEPINVEFPDIVHTTVNVESLNTKGD